MSEPAADRSGPKLHTNILVGLDVGAVAGVVMNLTLGANHPTIELVNTYLTVPVGQVFLRTGVGDLPYPVSRDTALVAVMNWPRT